MSFETIVFHGHVDKVPGLVGIHRIWRNASKTVAFVWFEIADGNYSVAYIQPVTNVLQFLVLNEITGQVQLDDLNGFTNHLSGLSFAKSDIRRISKKIVRDFNF